jgi:hypothetical protein
LQGLAFQQGAPERLALAPVLELVPASVQVEAQFQERMQRPE